MTRIPPILCYHQVVPWPFLGRPPLKPGLIVPLRRFRWQVALLRAWGYTGISLRQWVDGVQGRGPLPRKPVVITFDDGYYGVHQYALPVLRRAGFTATVYVIAEDFTDAVPGDRAYPVLDRRRAREWMKAGMEVGCHSLTHPRLDECTGPELLREVVASREVLEREFGVEVRTFAYPYANPGPRVVQCVRDHGYAAAVGLSPAAAGDLFTLPRIPLGYAQKMPGFIRRLLSYRSLPETSGRGHSQARPRPGKWGRRRPEDWRPRGLVASPRVGVLNGAIPEPISCSPTARISARMTAERSHPSKVLKLKDVIRRRITLQGQPEPIP